MAVTQASVDAQRAKVPVAPIQHALGLHLYQPAGNLRLLLQSNEQELRRILLCYERVARHAHKYPEVARLHLALSTVLLEQLREPAFVEDCRHLVDIPAILDQLRSAANIELIGTGYRHAPLPLVPPADWEEQLRNERLILETEFGRVPKGYWPPAGLFDATLVPALVRTGYQYVLLPGIQLVTTDGDGADPYRPYRLCHGGACITVVPYDRGFSQAQEFGLDAPWFADEVRNGVALAPGATAPYLLTTWSDGENGEWFRRLDEEHGFFGQYFSPYMEFCETGEFPVSPVHLSDYLRAYPAEVDVELRPQPDTAPDAEDRKVPTAVRERLSRVATAYWSLTKTPPPVPAPSREALSKARELILQAEDSGFLMGDTDRQQAMLALLDQAEELLGMRPPKPAPGAPARKPTAKPASPPRQGPRLAGRKGKATRTAKKKPHKRRP